MESVEKQSVEHIYRSMEQKLGSQGSICFVTTNGSVYLENSSAEVVRYKKSINTVQNKTKLTMFCAVSTLSRHNDPKRMDVHPQFMTDSYIIIHLENKERVFKINSFQDMIKISDAENVSLKDLADKLYFCLDKYSEDRGDDQYTYPHRYVRVSIIPKEGLNPIDFYHSKNQYGQNIHIGNAINKVIVKGKQSDEEFKQIVKAEIASI